MFFTKIQYKKVVIVCWGIILLNSAPINGSSIKKRSLADDLRTGFSFAGKILGFDPASSVADLVSRAFANNYHGMQKHAHFEANRDTEKLSDDSDASQSQSAINDEVETNIIGGSSVNGIGPGSFIGNVLRVFGMDNSRIGAMAVNGIIFIAQMIGRVLMTTFGNGGNNSNNGFSGTANTNEFPLPEGSQQNPDKPAERARSLTFDNAFDWIIEKQTTNPMFSHQLTDVKDKKLPQRLIRSIEGVKGANDSNAACIKLLLCKCEPIIWGMQRAVIEQIDKKNDEDDGGAEEQYENTNRLNVFFKHLPDVEEFKNHGFECETQYSNCKIYP